MNFFGHAAIARWCSRDSRLLFGAMLPDLVGMIGAPMPKIRCAVVRAGVAHHHATDDVFHRTETFRQLSGAAGRHLESFGLRRGSALAVAHVGVELLIDCTLGVKTDVCRDYLAALDAGAPDTLRADLQWATLEYRERYVKLHAILLTRGLAVVDSAPERLAQRLQRALARRPRLALADEDCPVVEAWARGAHCSVADAVPTLLDELRVGLAKKSMGDRETAAQ